MTIDKIAWIYIKDRKALFVRSKIKDVFYTPGGKREGTETDPEALAREIKEELNAQLILDSIKYLHTVTAQAHGKPEGTLVEIKCYTAQYEGELKPSSEIEEYDWLSSTDEERTPIAGKLLLRWLKEKNLID